MSLCPVCDIECAALPRCSRCGEPVTLGDGFTLERLLGTGGQSRVYAARQHGRDLEVALKIMSLHRVRDPKSIELFRRAAQVMEGLNHPGIARLVTYFETTRPTAALFCLAQEFVPGATLANSLQRGERFDERSVVALARQILDVLNYLHGLSPPVIHRDLKPSNIMRRPDGQIVLIDFDLVRDVMRPEGGSTVSIGTPGYTPMEQYMGDAAPSADLYALGVTLAVLLSRKEPTEMRRGGEQRLSIREHVNISPGFARVLERLIEPDLSRRYASVGQVLRDLDSMSLPPAQPAPEGGPSPTMAMWVGALTVLGVAVVSYLVASPSSRSTSTASKMESTPVAAATPVASAAALTGTPSPSRSPPAHKPTLAERIAPTPALLLGSSWEGQVGDAQVRLNFAKTSPIAAQLIVTDGTLDLGPLQKLRAEISSVGVLVLSVSRLKNGVSIEQSYFANLRTDGTMDGTMDTSYDSKGSSYTSHADFRLTRLSREP